MRFVQIDYGDYVQAVAKPVAGLLTDLKQHGLLEIPLSGGEFGRTPRAEKNGTTRD